MKHEYTTTSPTKVRVFRYTTKQQEERVEVSTQSTKGLKSRDKSTTSRSTRSAEQTKAAKIETETSLQRAERLEV